MIAVVLGVVGAGVAGAAALRARALVATRPSVAHDPLVAWHRGVAYAGAVVVVASLTGTTTWMLEAAWVPESDAGTSSGVGLVVVVALLYGSIWARGTDGFGRAPASAWSVAIGVLWGAAAGGVVLRTDGSPLRYNAKADILNPWFIAAGVAEHDWAALAA